MPPKPPLQPHTMLKNKFLPLAGLAVVLALAIVLNPSPEKHRARIKSVVAERSPLAGLLGVGEVTAFMSNYHSLGLASYTVAGERVASLGAFGLVFVLQD
jgi:hypothetical protein